MPDGGPEQFVVVGSRTACYPVVKRRGVPDSVSACVRASWWSSRLSVVYCRRMSDDCGVRACVRTG